MNILSTLERQEVYDEVRRLKEADATIDVPTLRRELMKQFAVIPSRTTLKRWLIGETSPTTSMTEFRAEPSEPLSFFLGAWLGDGWADEADGGKRLLLKVRSREFAEEFAAAATKVLGKSEPYRAREVNDKNGRWYQVKVTSLLLFEFVNRPFSELISTIERYPIAFLRGFATAEGNPSVSIERKKRPYLSVTVCISNTDMDYIRFARSQLERLGYSPTAITTGYIEGTSHPIRGQVYTANKTKWQFRICRIDEVRRFAAEVGFADNAKQDKTDTSVELIRAHNPFNAVARWESLFTKVNRKWTRNNSPDSR